ncbi:MAG: hypothetical protein JWL97_3602 [Gemmatimonadales bacterium]|nr:hypothetical protein [Acidobacteriaceae bacterium]MDB4872598.1 hypothetical protein [Gemmatimonadales bacterium]
MLKLLLPAVLLLTLCVNLFAQTSSAVEVLYVAGPQGTSSVSLHTYNVNPKTAVASQVGSAIPVHKGSIDPLTIGTSHYIYLWNSNGVWLYPTSANGAPASTPSQHLIFSFAHPVNTFLVNPDGKFAYAALAWGTYPNNYALIVLFTIDQSTGRLTNTNQVVASYSHPYIGFTKFLFGSQGGKLFAKWFDDGPHTSAFGFDYYPVNQTTGQLGKLQSLFYAQTFECQTSCTVTVTSALSAADGVCCGPGSGGIQIARTSTGQSFSCGASNQTFCGDDVANLAIDPANTNLFFGDATVNETFIGNIDFTTSQLTASASTIPGTPPVFFSPDSRLVYAMNSNDIGIYALHASTGALTASTTLPDSGAVSIATATLHN